MTKITNNEFYAISRAINNALENKEIERVYIYENSNWTEKIKTFGVNWSALGTVDASEAIRFSEQLQWASKIAEHLNNKKYTVEYVEVSEEEEIKQYTEFTEKLYQELLNL